MHAVDMSEQELQAAIDQWDLHKHEELKLQLQGKKQAALQLKRMAELQGHSQDDQKPAQQIEILRERQLMFDAQGGSVLKEQIMSASTIKQVVQLGNTPFNPELQVQAVLSGSTTVAGSTEPAAQSSKVVRIVRNPGLFRSQIIYARCQEWIGGGQHAIIKSQLNKSVRGWELPRNWGPKPHRKGIRHSQKEFVPA